MSFQVGAIGLGEEQSFAVLTELYWKPFNFINFQPVPTVTCLSSQWDNLKYYTFPLG